MSFVSSRPGIKAKLLPRYPASVSATAPIVASLANGALALSYDSSSLADAAPVDPSTARIVVREGTTYKESSVTDILGASPAMAAMTVKANVTNTSAAVADVALENFAKPIGLNIARADISSVYIPLSAIVVQGYSTLGDEGVGAVYVRGTAGGVNAIQDAGGTWWNLYIGGRPVNPGWFGAVKDGVTDDSPAILAAGVAVGAAGGGTVQLESGTYFVNTAGTHPSYVEFAGRGRTTIVKLGTGIALTSQWLTNTNTSVSVANTRIDTQMVVRDIYFDCSARTYPKYLFNEGTGLDVAGATDPVRNAALTTPMTTTSGSTSATVPNAAWNVWIGMTVSHANVPSGTTVANVSGTTITLSAQATGSGAANATFTPVSPYTTTGYILRYINCTDVLVTGCYFADNGSTSVLMQGCFDSGTRDNFIFRCGRVDFSSNSFLLIHTGTARAIVGATQGATTALTLNAAHTFGAPVTPTIDTVNLSASITVSSATGISVGMEIVSVNVPAGTTVTAINGTTISMSAAATASASGTASTFYTRVMVYGLGGLGNVVTDGLYRVTAVGSTTTLTIDVNTSARNDFILDGRGIVGSYFLTLADRCFSENDRAFACNRAMIQMGPSRGGRIVSPSMRQMKEAGIYLAYAQDTQISNPVILDVTRSDLVASGIEQNYCAETTVIGGSIRNTDGPSLNGVGIIGTKVNGTSLENPVYTSSQTYPYGPFNEGVGFGGGFNLGLITTTAASTSATVAAVSTSTITTTNASTTVTPTSMVGLEVGQTLVSANIPTGAYITAVGTSTVTVSAAATATAGPTACSFYPLNIVTASSTTVTTVSGSTRVTPTSMANLRVGQVVTSANIPAGTIVTKVETSTVVLSAAATGTAGPTACTWTECRRLVSSGLTAGTLAIVISSLPTITLSQVAAGNTTAVGCRFNPYDSGGAPIQMDQRSAVLLNSSAGYACLNNRFDGVEALDSRGNASGVFYMTRSGGSAAGTVNRLGVTAIDVSRFQRRGGISGITQANPAVITTDADHGLQNNATVYIRQVAGMTAINGGPYVVTRLSATTFSIPVDSTAFGAYSAGIDYWGQTDNGFDFQDANTALGSTYVTTRLYS